MSRLLLCALLLVMGYSIPLVAQPAPSEDAALHIRALVLKGLYDQAVSEGKAFLATHDDSELKAWYLAGLAGSGETKEAIETADLMVAMEGENPWSWFAKAAAYTRAKGQEKEALAASDKALTLNPEHPDFVWLRAEALLVDGTPESHQRLISLFAKYDALVQRMPELLDLKARVFAK